MSINQCQTWKIGLRAGTAATFGAAVLCILVAGAAGAVSAPVALLKQMPAKGTVRQGEVVYVDDGRCPSGAVKKITGGNQKAGVARQVECVKRPSTTAEP